VHAENVDVRIFGDAFLDVGVEPDSQLLAFLLGLGEVNYFRALGFRHYRITSVGVARWIFAPWNRPRNVPNILF